MEEAKTRRVQVTVTEGCYKAVKQYAALRGMTMSECMYLAFRYNLHREALEEQDVRRIFERNGIPLDEEVKARWQKEIALKSNLDAVFTPRPAEVVA